MEIAENKNEFVLRRSKEKINTLKEYLIEASKGKKEKREAIRDIHVTTLKKVGATS